MSYVFGSLQVEDNFTGARSYVRAATTVAGTLATSFANTQSVDGVTLATGDRILIKNQASGVENGIYIVEDAGAPTRSGDMPSGDAASGVYTWVREGTANANTAWICTNAPGSDVVNSDPLVFAQFDVVADLVVSRGGTGVSSLTSGQVLVGAGTAAVDLTKAAPTGDFVGTSDAQTLTNKTLTAPTVSGDILFDEATNDLTLAVADQGTGTATATIPDLAGVSQDLVLTAQSQTLTNKTLTAPVLNSVPTLSLDDTDSAFDLTVQSTSTLTADQTLTIDTNAASRTLSMGGDISTGGTLTTADAFTTSGAFPITLTATASTSVTLPTSGTLANQAYVDSVVQGLDVKESVVATSDDALNDNASISGSITYNNTGGASGRGQITATLAVSDTFTLDGVTFGAADNGSRILLKNEADTVTAPDGARNGIWTTTISGTSLTLDRATDFDSDAEVTSGAFTFTEEGTINGSTGWVLTTPDPIIIGGASGTALTFTLFSASGDVIAGLGLSKTGNQLDVNVTNVSTGINSDNVIVRSSGTAGQVLRSTAVAGDEATWGALDLANSSAVTGVLDLANGGTNSNTLNASPSRIVQVNTAGTALETTTTPRVTALHDTGGDELITFTEDTTPVNNFNIANADTGLAPILRAAGEANIGIVIADSNSNELLTLDSVAAAVNDFTLTNAATGVAPTFRSSGEANTGMIIADSNSNEILVLGSVASAVNEVTITNAATTVNPTIRSSGEANTGLILADSNSNEVLILESVASAVNEITITNAATGTAPVLEVTGGDANIDLSLQAKGTGVYNFNATASVPAEIRLFEDTDLGSSYVGIDVPNVSASYTLTLPAAVGTSQQVLRLADGSGNLEFATIAAATGLVGYSIWSGQISATNNSSTPFAYFAWDNSQYSTYDSPSTVVFWYESVIDRDLIVTVFNATTSLPIGTTTIASPAANGIGTISITNPTADARIEFRAHKSANGGTNPQIYGIQWEFTH